MTAARSPSISQTKLASPEESASPTRIPTVDDTVAITSNHMAAQDKRGKLTADAVDVFYDKGSKRISKIVAAGNVVVENPDGNKTYSDNVIYLADEGRIILGGDAEALYIEGTDPNVEKGIV